MTIVGGGLSGVEVLGELLRAYRNDGRFHFQLVDSVPRLLADCSPKLDALIKRRVRSLAVHFHLGKIVKSVSEWTVDMHGGQSIGTDITIWTGGQRPPDFLHRKALASSPTGWATVNEQLQSTRQNNVSIVGDAAKFPAHLDKQASHAIDMGRHAARNIRRYFSGQSLRAFRHAETPRLISFGDLDTFLAF